MGKKGRKLSCNWCHLEASQMHAARGELIEISDWDSWRLHRRITQITSLLYKTVISWVAYKTKRLSINLRMRHLRPPTTHRCRSSILKVWKLKCGQRFWVKNNVQVGIFALSRHRRPVSNICLRGYRWPQWTAAPRPVDCTSWIWLCRGHSSGKGDVPNSVSRARKVPSSSYDLGRNELKSDAFVCKKKQTGNASVYKEECVKNICFPLFTSLLHLLWRSTSMDRSYNCSFCRRCAWLSVWGKHQ